MVKLGLKSADELGQRGAYVPGRRESALQLNMKSAVFARPNLKLFLLAAILIAVVNDLVLNGPPTASGSGYAPPVTHFSEAEIRKLVLAAEQKRDPELFARISYLYEKHGDPRKAL